MSDGDLLTVSEAAKLVRLSEQRVRQLVKGGHIRARQFVPRGRWRIDRQSLESLRQERETAPQPEPVACDWCDGPTELGDDGARFCRECDEPPSAQPPARTLYQCSRCGSRWPLDSAKGAACCGYMSSVVTG